MKLWQNKYKSVDSLIEQFTVGDDAVLDLQLAKYDIKGNIAHVQMLESVGLLTKTEVDSVVEELKNILLKIEEGSFKIEKGIEDIHSQVELLLTQKLGEVGKKIHLARSRNDQVLVDLRLFFRAKLDEIASKLVVISQELLRLAELNKDKFLPGFTHTQLAMPSSFGMWLGAYAESLIDDIEHLRYTQRLINKNPLGSAAGYGSNVPIDRILTTSLLDFEEPCVNAVFAQMGRGKTEWHIANTLGAIALTINKFSNDVCLYNSQLFEYIKLPNEFTTGSSIMPHKKNPDVFELIRATSNLLINSPSQIVSVIANLTSGYHRDFQLLKKGIFTAINDMETLLDLLGYCLPNMIFCDIDPKDPKYQYLFCVNKVNDMVLGGMPFRDAYKLIAEQIEQSQYVPYYEAQYSHLGSLGNLGLDILHTRLKKWE